MRFVLCMILLFPNLLQAGYYELGFSGTYRKLHLPTDASVTRKAFDTTSSLTGSIAYYFAEMAAAELNFTQGQSERFVPGTTIDSRTTYNFHLIGLDLIFTFADRKAPFVPYVKAGVAYFSKKRVTYEFIDATGTGTINQPPIIRDQDPNYVPSLGFGLKIRITKTMALKVGLEAWTSDALHNDPEWDIAGRGGISWFF